MADNSSSSYVDDILAAETLYEVLGVPRDIDGTDNTLRRAYLKQSVKVHPDKNNDPRATQAFQRVAEAWSTLSEPSSKADYDRYLRYGSGGNQQRGGGQQQQSNNNNDSGYGHNQETYYASETGHNTSPSFQEALFMFATMTSMFSGGSGSKARFVGDMAQTLMWAQQLAEGRKQQQQQQQQQQQRGFDPNNCDNGGYNNDNDNNNNMNDNMQNKAATGFMLGGGLRAVAGAQHMLGFKKSAAAMEKAATAVEVAAVGSVLAENMKDNPMVKKAIERGQNAMKDPKVANALRGSLRFAGELAKSYREASSSQQSNNNNINNQQQQQQQQYNYQR